MSASSTAMRKRARALVASARARAKERGLPFALGEREQRLIEAVLDRGVCEMTGMYFSYRGGRSGLSPSLDRIKPADGYVPGNVRVICWAMNSALGDWGEDLLRGVMQAWLARSPQPLVVAPPIKSHRCSDQCNRPGPGLSEHNAWARSGAAPLAFAMRPSSTLNPPARGAHQADSDLGVRVQRRGRTGPAPGAERAQSRLT
jgi:hypothetical protein